VTILGEARRLVYGQRNGDYGHPRLHWGRTVGMLNALGFRRDGRLLRPSDWADAMIAEKLARRANDQTLRDNLVDIAGYAAAAERLWEDIYADDPVQEEGTGART
jgi:hypothetical protein